MTPIKFTKSSNINMNLVLDKCEVSIAEYTDTNLMDLVHNYFPDRNDLKPVKCIKIGNGGIHYSSLKSIIILNNADFIIVDGTGSIIDYITNSNPFEPVGYNK